MLVRPPRPEAHIREALAHSFDATEWSVARLSRGGHTRELLLHRVRGCVPAQARGEPEVRRQPVLCVDVWTCAWIVEMSG